MSQIYAGPATALQIPLKKYANAQQINFFAWDRRENPISFDFCLIALSVQTAYRFVSNQNVKRIRILLLNVLTHTNIAFKCIYVENSSV